MKLRNKQVNYLLIAEVCTKRYIYKIHYVMNPACIGKARIEKVERRIRNRA